MRLTRFQTLLDARGPEMGPWPDADRMAASALLAESDAARGALAEARALDRALSAPPGEPASALLRSTILDIPERHDRLAPPLPGRQSPVGDSGHRRLFITGWTAIAASALIGFAVGLWWPAQPPVWQSEDLVALVYGIPDIGAPDFDEVLR